MSQFFIRSVKTCKTPFKKILFLEFLRYGISLFVVFFFLFSMSESRILKQKTDSQEGFYLKFNYHNILYVQSRL